MLFAFDEPKRQANLAKHGFDLAAFETAFGFDRFLNIPAKPRRTGRARFKLIGLWHGDVVVVAIVSPSDRRRSTSPACVGPTARRERPMAKRDPASSYVSNDLYSRADWEAVDNPPLTDAELARARPGSEGMPPAMAEAFVRRGGRPRVERPRVPVSLRVPAEVLDAYKAGGPGWQTRMNEALAAGLVPPDAPAPSRSSGGRRT